MKRARQALVFLWGLAFGFQVMGLTVELSRATVGQAIQSGLIALLLLELSWRDK